MLRTNGLTPPFTPVLLAGLAVRVLPLAPLQPLLAAAMAAMHRRHRGVFERLSDLANPVFLIDPVDLPLAFVLHADPVHPTLRATRAPAAAAPAAVIRGPLLSLIDLLEGRIDGDALFFTRELVIEGDTEAVLALRNAVDGADIDVVEDVLAPLGPLAAPLRRLIVAARRTFALAAGDLEAVRAAIVAPAVRRCDARAAELAARLDEAGPARERGRA